MEKREEKLLCVPCMMNLSRYAHVTLINKKSGKIDCAGCGRRKYGSLYAVEIPQGLKGAQEAQEAQEKKAVTGEGTAKKKGGRRA